MAYVVFIRESDTCEWFAHGPNDLRTLRMKDCVILDSSQSNNASWKSMKEILQTNFTMKSKYLKVPLAKLFTDVEAL
jgi:hypothetical protein